MESLRGKIGLAVATAAFLLAATAALAPAAGQGPRPAIVTAHGDDRRTSVGSYCVSGPPGTAQCADAAALTKPPKRRLKVAQGATIRVVFQHRRGLEDEVRSIQAELVRLHRGAERAAGGPITVRPVEARTWSLRMPRGLGGANLLRIFARFDDGGNASHYIGLRRIRKRRLACPIEPHTPVRGRPLLGLTIPEARRKARLRGCELRVARRDGKDVIQTDDLGDGRVNVAVRDGVVRRVTGVF